MAKFRYLSHFVLLSIFFGGIEHVTCVKIFPGVEIVEAQINNEELDMLRNSDNMSDSIFQYLKTHELKLELSTLLNASYLAKKSNNASDSFLSNIFITPAEARKRDKGGIGYVLLMGGMLGKMMAAMGFGGVAMLAMKALGASLAALMLSSVVGLKKLSEQGNHESHVQYIFRKARDFFDQQEINIVDGLSFNKDTSRAARSINVDSSAIESANTIESREDALENYVSERAMNFFQERSLNLDMMSVGRAVSQVIPEEVKESMRSMVGEARKKKKKLLKKLLPLLGLVKLKAQGLILLALVGIAIIAKKALVIGVIALVLAKLGLIKAIIAKVSSKASGAAALGDLIGGLGGGSSSGGEAVAYQAYAPQSSY
uniref:CSON013605 protein n=1 Tax=Culicoides sonorensis TaxID=179676 RepID=A0A336MKM3_CULSO